MAVVVRSLRLALMIRNVVWATGRAMAYTGAGATPLGETLDETVDSQARRFGRARVQRSAALLEDYAELIADMLALDGEARPTDIARRLGVSHVTVVKAIDPPEARGAGDRAALSRRVPDAGGRGAGVARVRARHRLVVDLLIAVGVPREDAENDAEGIEHHVSPTTLDAFARFLKPA